jgi:hypothetical protein
MLSNRAISPKQIPADIAIFTRSSTIIKDLHWLCINYERRLMAFSGLLISWGTALARSATDEIFSSSSIFSPMTLIA